jgi:hypothetical protein
MDEHLDSKELQLIEQPRKTSIEIFKEFVSKLII